MDQQASHNQGIAFIERKLPDPEVISELLGHAARSNHWANNGPVVQRLELALGEAAGIGPGQAVVACSSGTAALNVLAGVHAMQFGRQLRWAVSAFGFFSTVIGPYADAALIDCDETGMLDLDLLAKIPEDQYDGVCVTNIFGQHREVDRYVQFCRDRNKRLIVDNAFGLMHFDRGETGSPDEIISLHHTKPWGFGEGGCAIVSREHEAAARALINFGVGMEQCAAPYAFNGKMSDVSAAYILDHLQQATRLAPEYARQYQRITALVAEADLPLRQLNAPCGYPAGTAQAVFVADHPIREDQLDNPHFTLRKYYRPLTSPWPKRADDLYACILNVPCHSGMSGVTDSDIVDVLERIFGAEQ